MAATLFTSFHRFTPSVLSLLLSASSLAFCAAPPVQAAPPSLVDQPPNTWVLRTPLAGGIPSPRLGYEGACVWAPRAGRLVRYGGHNQGGGGEQGAEVWSCDLESGRWTLHEPNTSPPGVCCNAQNVFDPVHDRYVRFPFFSGSHGWQWSRELYLNDSSVWTYDLTANCWRNMRPLPAPRLAPYRCASWDTDERIVVVFGGEGSREGTLIYDPARNEWRWPKPQVEPAPRSGGNMAYDAARKLHVLFGSQFDDDAHTWTYDVRKNEWRDTQPAVQPPTNKNDAVLTYDPHSRQVLAIVKLTTGVDDSAAHELQTWAYDAGANQWRRLAPTAEPTPSGNRARNLTFAPELNLAILENCPSKPREQQVWTYRLTAASPAAPPPPAAALPIVVDGVASVLSERQIELTWTPPTIEGVRGYVVERAAVEVYSDDQLKRLKQRTAPLEQPVVGALRRIGPFRPLNAAPLVEPRFVDSTIDLAQPSRFGPADEQASPETEFVFDRSLPADQVDPDGRPYQRGVYAYCVRVVHRDGELSGPSPPLFTIPSSPQQVFSREVETACDLKWQPNPERGIVGYRIYRMDGRYDKDPVSRLTTTPLAAAEYRDESAGKSARRYYVVAVDALGQEGFPSSPVWHRREWREFYVPFTGEWHQ
ncbi:MAG: hypothetical protein U0939_25625 [Pirellulales bacterium]